MTLSRDQAWLAAGVILGGLAVVLFSPWSPLTQAAAPAGQEGLTWSPSQPLSPHYARGGIWHPPVAGEGRTGLLRHGWAWISAPPSEATGPGVTDA